MLDYQLIDNFGILFPKAFFILFFLYEVHMVEGLGNFVTNSNCIIFNWEFLMTPYKTEIDHSILKIIFGCIIHQHYDASNKYHSDE